MSRVRSLHNRGSSVNTLDILAVVAIFGVLRGVSCYPSTSFSKRLSSLGYTFP